MSKNSVHGRLNALQGWVRALKVGKENKNKKKK